MKLKFKFIEDIAKWGFSNILFFLTISTFFVFELLVNNNISLEFKQIFILVEFELWDSSRIHSVEHDPFISQHKAINLISKEM